MISGGPFLSRPLCFTADTYSRTSHAGHDIAQENINAWLFGGAKKTPKKKKHTHKLGPAKTYILGGAPRTYAIKTRAVTDN